MEVVWSDAAEHDLQEIASYISADNPIRAVSFAKEITDTAHATGEMPHAFPLVPRLEHKGVRRRIHGRYLILYRVTAQRVEILHVVHGARDYVKALFSGGL